MAPWHRLCTDAVQTGFRPPDGARFLDQAGVDSRVVALVAHHSAAISEATELELADDLAVYPDECSIVRDLL
ncbi:hypothetical protein GCM10009836_44830 [Pseudonocardia ailaonensis]|uniref:Uncharacterized protein n=1 Tax=Pseudonocardia ailaonensis TaxID=367279 RepID=A0ABN2ND30_9PSEU